MSNTGYGRRFTASSEQRTGDACAFQCRRLGIIGGFRPLFRRERSQATASLDTITHTLRPLPTDIERSPLAQEGASACPGHPIAALRSRLAMPSLRLRARCLRSGPTA